MIYTLQVKKISVAFCSHKPCKYLFYSQTTKMYLFLYFKGLWAYFYWSERSSSLFNKNSRSSYSSSIFSISIRGRAYQEFSAIQHVNVEENKKSHNYITTLTWHFAHATCLLVVPTLSKIGCEAEFFFLLLSGSHFVGPTYSIPETETISTFETRFKSFLVDTSYS